MRRALAVAALSFSCAAAPPRGEPVDVVVRSDDGAQLWRGKATFGVRSARAGKAERVVSLPSFGEIQTGLANDTTCRLVYAHDGLDALTLYEGAACPTPSRARLCFEGARFTRAGAAALVVDGCADENDLLWSKLDGPQPATVGPVSFRQRCRKIPQVKGCALTYVKKNRVAVESNDSGDDGFALAYDGERWRACFLEKETGGYEVSLVVEDACGARRDVTLEGHSGDLDD